MCVRRGFHFCLSVLEGGGGGGGGWVAGSCFKSPEVNPSQKVYAYH